jgi:PAS domain-containing protein
MGSSGSGPVITYKLRPEEIEKWKKEGVYPMLTREKYLQLRLDGMSRTHIQRNYFPSNPTKFYALLSEWGLKEKDAEERALDMMPAVKKLEEKPTTAQEKTGESEVPFPAGPDLADLLREKDAEIERLRQAAQDLKAKLDSFADGILERDQKISRLNGEINRLNEEISRWQSRLEDAAGRLAQYEAEKRSGSVDNIECIDAIFAATTGLTGGQAYSTGAAIEYLWRWSRKGGVEDLRKARWYIDRLIAELEVEAG